MKKDVDLPRYSLFFIKEIQESINEYNIVNEGDSISIEICTQSHPYSYDGLKTVVSTFIRKGYKTRLPDFKMVKDGDEKNYVYSWNLAKAEPGDDLPF